MSSPSFLRKILDFFGIALASDLKILQENFDESTTNFTEVNEKLKQSQNEVSKLKKDLNAEENAKEKLQDRLDLLAWADPYLVGFGGDPSVYGDIPNYTDQAWATFGNGDRIGDLRAFKGGINPAGLFWALTHASLSGRQSIDKLENEDSMTAAFVNELRTQLGNAEKHLNASLNVFAYEISKKLKPALKEVSVGADLLLMISGSGLVRGGGMRLIWVQFKQNQWGQNLPFELDVYRKANTKGKKQLDVLRNVHQPDLGSYCIYALASPKINFFSAVSVGQLKSVDANDRQQCKIDLKTQGLRFQELLVLLSTHKSAGQFENSSDVTKFVNSFDANAIMPLTILSVSSGREIFPSKDIARQLRYEWDKRLTAYIEAMTPQRKKDLQIEDEGPSLER